MEQCKYLNRTKHGDGAPIFWCNLQKTQDASIGRICKAFKNTHLERDSCPLQCPWAPLDEIEQCPSFKRS